METSVNDILLVAGSDFLLFSLLFICFSIYRKLRSQKVELALDVSVLRPYMNEAEHATVDIAKKVMSMSLEDIYTEVGEWAFVYLYTLRFIVICLVILTVPGCGILLVIYCSEDDSNKYQNIQKTGIANIMDTTNYLIVPVVFLIVFSVVIYTYALICLNFILKTKPKDAILATEPTIVIVKYIPQDYSKEFVSSIIEKHLNEELKNSIVSINAIPQYIEPYKFYLKAARFEKKIKFMIHDFEKTGKRVMIRKNCKKIDGITFYENERTQCLDTVNKLKKKFKHMNAGVCFIKFDCPEAARKLITSGLHSTNSMRMTNWDCSVAPPSCDLIWENLGTNISCSIIRKFLTNLLFIVIFFVIITPTYLESILRSYLDLIHLTSFIVGTLTVSLPSLILVIYQLIILPPAVNFMVNQEKHTKKHTQVTARLRKYFFFLIFYTLFYPILGLQFINFIELILKGNWEIELGTKVNLTGQLFFVFLIHQAFLKNGFDLLVTSKYIWSATKAFLASSETEKKVCFEAEPFEFDFELAVSLNSFCITCGMSIIYPLVLLPGLLFFTIRYFVHKHNILSVFYVDKKSSAFPSLMTIMFGILLSSFLMQVLTGAALAMSGDPSFALFGKVFLVISFIVFVVVCVVISKTVRKGRSNFLAGLEQLSDEDEDSYKHPMDRVQDS